MTEYDEFLAEHARILADRIKIECGAGQHSWRHGYGDMCWCQLCGEDLKSIRLKESRQ